MSPKKPKGKDVDNENLYELTRKPLYPDLTAEKDNMDFLSSDDSPEKVYPNSHSPRSQRTNIYPSSTDFLPDEAISLKRRKQTHQRNLTNQFEDIANQNISPKSRYSKNSDVEGEMNDFDVDNHHDQEQELSEKSQSIKKNKPFLLKSDGCKDPSGAQRNFDQFQYQGKYASVSTSEPCNFFLTPTFMYLCIILILSALFIYFWVLNPGKSSINDQFDATTLVKNLKSEFENQPRMTFRVIHSALKNTLEPEPESPAIILLLATNGSNTVCSEFAHKLVDSLSVPKFTVKILGKNFVQVNVDKAKMDMDKKISEALKINELGSVLIEDLDQIPGQTAIILHKYYDHENAPFKKAVFVMTVNYNKAISDYSDLKVWDKAAYDYLLSVWTDIGVDQVTALLSRLTVSVGVITVEPL